MKKRILNISLILALASTGSVFAQQGFGTNTPDKSAAVDITASNKGLLIPRIALQSDVLEAPITNPTKSLMVYNTTVNTTLKEGFYFWNGTKWEWFATASNDLNTTNVSLAVAGGKLVLTDSDGHPVDVNVSDINTDNQQIETFAIGTDNILTLTLEDGGTKTVDLTPYFNSTKLANGTNTTVSGDGFSTTPYAVNVATATKDNLGVVKIGSGINVANGEISVPAAPGETTTVITDALTGTNKHKIADYKNETTNPVVDIYETVTALSQDASGISYQPETGAAQSAKVVSANADNIITLGTDHGAFLEAEDIHANQKTTTVKGTAPISVSPAAANATGNTEYTISANVATASTVGVVMPGNGLSVDGTGKLDVTFPPETVDTNTKNRSLDVVDVNLVLTDTDNETVQVPLADLDKQQLSLTDNTLALTNGGNVDLALYLDNTDEQKLSYEPTTNVLSLTNGGTVDLSVLAVDTNTDEQQLSLTDNTLALTNGGNVDLAPYLDNRDEQKLSYEQTTNVLSLTNGGTVDLSVLAVDTNTDEQQLSYNATTNVLTLERGGDPINLSALGTDTNSKSVVTAGTNKNVVVTSSGPDASDITTYTVAVKNAMPKFFYMPSVLINTANSTGSVNLYTTYTGQFSTPLVSSGSAETGGIPTLSVKELDFYVTYYDANVISNVNITDDGVMNYTVIGAPTNLSFINVVFKVRDTPKP